MRALASPATHLAGRQRSRRDPAAQSACCGSPIALVDPQMAARFENGPPNRGQPHETTAHETTAHEPEIAVARARSWALGLMIAGSAIALLATSDPDKHAIYSFETSSDGPRVALSASEPQARYLLRARVIALGPDRVDTTESPLATVHGSISSDQGTGGTDGGAGGTDGGASPFVRVRLGTSAQASNTVSALTSFQLSRPLHFSGNCAAPDRGAPCQAELELELDLEQPSALPAEGSLSIDWSVDFESRAFKPKTGGSDELIAAPWTIQIVGVETP